MNGGCAVARSVMLAALLLVGCAAPRASLPVFGPGALTNVTCGEPGRSEDSCDRARTNASAHIAWALAVPAVGHAVGGRKGMRIAGAAWIVGSVLQEAFWHAPPVPDPGYPSEVRSDLISRIVPTLLLLGIDWLLASDVDSAVQKTGGGVPAKDPTTLEH